MHLWVILIIGCIGKDNKSDSENPDFIAALVSTGRVSGLFLGYIVPPTMIRQASMKLIVQKLVSEQYYLNSIARLTGRIIREDESETLAAGRIRERRPDNRPKIIAICLLCHRGNREKCLSMGMDGYISKPVRMQLKLYIRISAYRFKRAQVMCEGFISSPPRRLGYS
jgi:hypothetical protein